MISLGVELAQAHFDRSGLLLVPYLLLRKVMSPTALASERFLTDLNAPIVGLQVDKAFSQLR